VKEIPLTRGMVARVDDEDYERLVRHRWHLADTGTRFYVARYCRVGEKRGRSKLWMHREVIGAPAGLFVDHIDGDGLNNQKANLRLCTYSQNNRNKVKTRARRRFRGIRPVKDSKHGRWRADITINGKTRYLGTFATDVEAARAYDRVLIEVGGEFARPNFPDERSRVAATQFND